MITKYYGVFCAGKECHNFIQFGSYSAPDAATIGVDSTPGIHKCDECGTVCEYRREDVAHSISPVGTNPQFPHRRYRVFQSTGPVGLRAEYGDPPSRVFKTKDAAEQYRAEELKDPTGNKFSVEEVDEYGQLR